MEWLIEAELIIARQGGPTLSRQIAAIRVSFEGAC